MRTLLDNSTLSGAFRAIGLIENKNKALFDIDIACLRLLIDTVLLSDNIYIIDNYKEEYSENRKKWLDYNNIVFQKTGDKLDEAMLGHARAHVVNWKLSNHLGTE